MNTIAPPTVIIKGPENNPNSFTVTPPPFNPFSSSPPPDPIATGQTIEVTPEKPNITPPPQTVNFENPDFLKDFVGKKTIENKDTPPVINQPLPGTDSSMNEEDFSMAAEFLINAYSYGLGAVCRWYAKDTTDAAYMLSDSGKKPLMKSLTKLLVRYQSKFSIEMMFFMMLITAAITPFIKANNKRQENIEKKIQEDRKKAEALKVVKPSPPMYSNPYNDKSPENSGTIISGTGNNSVMNVPNAQTNVSNAPIPSAPPLNVQPPTPAKPTAHEKALNDIELLTQKFEVHMAKRTDVTISKSSKGYHDRKAKELYLEIQTIGAAHKIPTPLPNPNEKIKEDLFTKAKENDLKAITPKIEIIKKSGMPLPGKRGE